jgi:hypothetical protein
MCSVSTGVSAPSQRGSSRLPVAQTVISNEEDGTVSRRVFKKDNSGGGTAAAGHPQNNGRHSFWYRRRLVSEQELGHLIDSATNNRVRFIVAALNGKYTGPTYNGCGWVELGGYADTLWTDLVELWTRLNQALARAIERIPEERLSTQCNINEGGPVSLEFLIEDYVLHMQHHLDHILDRERQTPYPGGIREAPL